MPMDGILVFSNVTDVFNLRVVSSVNAFLAAALARVMSVAVSIPALASVSVLQSAAVGGSVVGVVGPL